MQAIIDVKSFLEKNKFVTLATSSLQMIPWISPVYFAYDQKNNLYWKSILNTQHSLNIKENSQISAIIYGKSLTDDPLQGCLCMTGRAGLVSQQEMDFALKIYITRFESYQLLKYPFEEIKNEFSHQSSTGLFKFTPGKYYSLKPPIELNGLNFGGRTEIKKE